MIHKLPLSLSILGFVISFSSYYRWLNLYRDPSSAYIGISIGLIIIFLSYILNWMKNLDDWKSKIDLRLLAHTSTKFGMEKEDMKKLAKGEEIE